MTEIKSRKVIHIDCDCFFASVEMRDRPELRDLPLAVGGTSSRGVIATCNYPARAFGVRSAMSSVKAQQLCPKLILLPGRMSLYSEVSRQIMAILRSYTPHFEQVSIDEAYLELDADVHASALAQQIREQIWQEVGVSVSAGVAPNKFLAKVASAWHKPNGQTLIRPQQVADFVANLPLAKIPGIGPVQQKRLARHQLIYCRDVLPFELFELVRRFGGTGALLYERVRGIDHRPVREDWLRKTLSVEQTFLQDLQHRDECLAQLPELWQRLQARAQRNGLELASLAPFVKVKFADFSQTTLADSHALSNHQAFARLLEQAISRAPKAVRLLGIGGRLPEVDRQQLPLF